MQVWEAVPVDPVPPRSTTQCCLEDLVAACESGQPTRGPIDVAHHITEATIAVAESHRTGGAWVELPLPSRDLYIFHV